jgi:hypothetical protein
MRTHRLGWELLNKQPIPSDRMGLHWCNNPPCGNGMHIYPGTKVDNARDALASGALFHRKRPTYPRGENASRAKLKDTDIPIIRSLFMEGNRLDQIAQRFSVTPSIIFNVIHGKSWTHVPSLLSESAIAAEIRDHQIHGETHHQAKLTENQVIEMRMLYRQGKRFCDIARQFGLTRSHARRIVLRKSWAHLP